MSECVTECKQAWFVYLVASCDDRWYCGVTTDVERRFAEHCSNTTRSARALRGKMPLRLLWHREVGDKSVALRFEYRIKRWPRGRKERLVAGDEAVWQMLWSSVAETNPDADR